MTMELFGEEKISPHVAAYVGDLFLLESLVLTEVDANLRDKRNTTPLHHAIYGGFEDCASFLLEMGAEVDALDDRGITPLQIASYQGHLDCLKLLIRHGANVNLADTTMPKDSITTIAGEKSESEELLLTRMNESYNCSALHIACLQGHSHCVKELLSNNADVEIRDVKGATVLHNCTFIGEGTCTKLICDSLTEKNRYILNLGDNNGITPLHQAAYLGHTNCLTILVQSNCDLTPKDAQGRTPLHLASYNGHKDCAEILLEEIRAIDLPRPASQSVATHKTLWRNHPNKVPLPPVASEIVEKSINGGDEYGATALHLAAYNGQVECGRVLLEVIQNVNVSDVEGSSPLHKAAFGGHEEFLSLFFSGKHKESCAVNAVDMFGDTPLHKAAYNGYDECAEILIQNGADRSLKDSVGYTALHNCAESKNLSCLDKIIDDKTINTTENNGFTALHLAVIESHLEVVQYLVSKLDIGVDINALDVSGRSPLYYAIEKANETITRELILEGADINVGHCTEIASSPISAINMDKLHQFVAEKERKEKMQKHMDPEMKAKISRIVALINAKPVKGLKMLIEEGIVETPTEIAEFLHQNEKLNKESIGELLGELDNKEIRKAFTEYLDFSNTSFEQALRHYLSTFKLPGEAQKIDRLMETFAHCFYEQTSDKSHFASPDAAFILAFSVIMLNTDAHNPAIKKQNRMTKQQFVNNNRGCNEGNDFDREFLEYIYDRIVEEEIKMPQAGGSIFNSAEKKGYLTKQGGRVKTWKKRWFVLASNNLYYFKAPGDENKPCGWIPLEDLKIVRSKDKKQKLTLILQSSIPGSLIKSGKLVDGKVVQGSHSRFIISAATEEELKSWIDAIEKHMQKTPIEG